ncbi:hypothetical protein AGMMS49928_13010 [Spirochaetia bacterium]|nr:hypothetical protein AGMMS49928_13010 [Spirochaetia bacterium]
MSYLYETHLHTCESSACAVSHGREYIKPYIDLGYTGVIITDHFFRGNSRIDRSLPWRRWVEQFCRGYEETREEGERRGLDVFFGWEETYDGDDYLIYGLDKNWLLEHPEAASWTRREQFAAVHRGGGCVVQAHPFRQHYYISKIVLSTGCVDAVEAANAGNEDQSYDALAMRYAEKLSLPVSAGSDIHRASDVTPDTTFGVYLEKKLSSITDYVRAIREGAINKLKTSPGRCDNTFGLNVRLPVEIRDSDDRRVRQSLKDLLDL